MWDQGHMVADYREHVTYTGMIGDMPISACSTGAGGGSTSSALEDLAEIGCDTLIRVGTCGTIQPDIKPGDLIICTGAVRKEGTSEGYVMKEELRMEYALAVDNVRKTYRDFWMRPTVHAVKGVSFSVRAGEVFGLLGPNGSGKSTTIKMILGLVRPDGGSISVFGRSPRTVEARRSVGYLPELSYMHPI